MCRARMMLKMFHIESLLVRPCRGKTFSLFQRFYSVFITIAKILGRSDCAHYVTWLCMWYVTSSTEAAPNTCTCLIIGTNFVGHEELEPPIVCNNGGSWLNTYTVPWTPPAELTTAGEGQASSPECLRWWHWRWMSPLNIFCKSAPMWLNIIIIIIRQFIRCRNMSIKSLQERWATDIFHSIRWLGGVVIRALDSLWADRGFDSRPLHCRATTLGKLVTPMCLCSPSSIIWYLGRAFMCTRLYVAASWVQWTRGVIKKL